MKTFKKKKQKKTDYRFLVESIKFGNETFPYKTALSGVNIKIQ